MKTSNQNDNRFTKDVLLRQIFQEISDETRENSPDTSVDDLIHTPENTSSKKSAFLKWIFILIFLIGLIFIWFYTITEVTDHKEVPTKRDNSVVLQTDEIVQKEETKIPNLLKVEPKKSLTLEETDTIQLIVETPQQIEDPRTEREKAKEDLLLQMRN